MIDCDNTILLVYKQLRFFLAEIDSSMHQCHKLDKILNDKSFCLSYGETLLFDFIVDNVIDWEFECLLN